MKGEQLDRSWTDRIVRGFFGLPKTPTDRRPNRGFAALSTVDPDPFVDPNPLEIYSVSGVLIEREYQVGSSSGAHYSLTVGANTIVDSPITRISERSLSRKEELDRLRAHTEFKRFAGLDQMGVAVAYDWPLVGLLVVRRDQQRVYFWHGEEINFVEYLPSTPASAQGFSDFEELASEDTRLIEAIERLEREGGEVKAQVVYPVRHYWQEGWYWCVPAACQTVLEFWSRKGISVDVPDVLSIQEPSFSVIQAIGAEMNTRENHGTELKDVVDPLKRFTEPTLEVKHLPVRPEWDCLQKVVSTKGPLIANRSLVRDHAVTVCGVGHYLKDRTRAIFVCDPGEHARFDWLKWDFSRTKDVLVTGGPEVGA